MEVCTEDTGYTGKKQEAHPQQGERNRDFQSAFAQVTMKIEMEMEMFAGIPEETNSGRESEMV
jgi:hypothetical protein